jgi:LVIVD repeat
MLKRALAVAAAALIVTSSVPAAAERAWEPSPGGMVSGPVEYVTTLPIDAGGAISAKLRDGLLYVTTFRSFSIYDVSDPVNPVPLSTKPLTPRVFMEQPDTNGKIAIFPMDLPQNALQIWDVSDPASPSEIVNFSLTRTDHMWTCVLDCRYAYGGRGTIIDLKDPASPKIVGDWAPTHPASAYHAIEEVAPGIVITGTVPAYVLDARKDPRNPTLVATFSLDSSSPPPAIAEWPDDARDRFALMSFETPFSGPCTESSGAFTTFDTKNYKKTKSFSPVDEYKLTSDGTFVDGGAPYNAVGCSPYAFGIPPDYTKSGRLAVPWFEQGMRLLDVSARGKISEVGGFLPFGGSSATAIWIDAEILYLIDTVRGIDILRVGK